METTLIGGIYVELRLTALQESLRHYDRAAVSLRMRSNLVTCAGYRTAPQRPFRGLGNLCTFSWFRAEEE